MTEPYPPPETRIYLNAPPLLRAIGCGGCGVGCAVIALLVFVLGGLFGILVSGWRALLGG